MLRALSRRLQGLGKLSAFLGAAPGTLTEEDERMAEMERVIGRVIAGRKNVHYILRTPMTFAKEQLQNADHVTRSAAVEYTTRVIAEIKATQREGSR